MFLAECSLTDVWTGSCKVLIKTEFKSKGVLIFLIYFSVQHVHKHPPETPNEIRDHKSNEGQSEDSENKHHHILGLMSISSS